MFYPDNPTQVSPDFLAKLDSQEPGTWLAQPKFDGWRRMCVRTEFGWEFHSKHRSAGSTRTLPATILSALAGLQLPAGYILDAEWLGPRGKLADELHVFDVLSTDGKPSRASFRERYETLCGISTCHPIRTVHCFRNPGLVDRFREQLCDPRSEGLVVRRADSKLLASREKCLTNPLWFKVKFRGVRESERIKE